MLRGGRGGGYAGGRMRGQPLPFEVDPELFDEADKGLDGGNEHLADIFPELTDHIMSAPITDDERRGVQIQRDMQARRQAGPFWTGTKADWAEIDAKRGESGGHDPFEDVNTYGKKRKRDSFKLADLSKVKLHKEFFPKELWVTIGATEDDEDDEAAETKPPKRKKTLGLAKKSTLDKLAKFDEGHEEVANPEAGGEEDGDEKADDEEDEDREPQDDDFDEDDDDADNDYNAEHYFDGGEEDGEDVGDDEYEDGY